MASPSDSLPTSASFTADRVTQCGEIRPEGREGERDRPNRVNTLPDAFERTLLAWRRLQVIHRFMLINAMRLYVTCRQVYGEGKELMTSEERREARYRRRTEARARKKTETCAEYDDFAKVFSYEHLYDAYRKSRRNVSWKASVQKYIALAPTNVKRTHERLMNGTFRSSGFMEFDINERGKKRHIRSVHIEERVVQRCLCDYCLVPMLKRTFVYDNAASLQNKGYSFSVRRLTQHLHEHYRKHGTEGYVLLYDFSKFFDRVSHELVKRITRREFSDERIIAIIDHFVDAFGDVGLGLGSQISQTFALAAANRLDHFIKEVLRIEHYGRYMDDGYLIHPSKEYLKKCLVEIERVCTELDITLNTRKTQIVKLSHGFTFLKIKFFFTETGRIIKKIYHRSVTKMRQKLKAFYRLYKQGIMTAQDVYASYQSWRAYSLNFNAYRTCKAVGALYDNLFIFRREEYV